MKFRKRPTVVEAIRYGGPQTGPDNDLSAIERLGAKAQVSSDSLWAKGDYTLRIWTAFDSWRYCSVGNWVVKTEEGFLVLRPEEFDAAYEPVEDSE
jgi:hypothetical protein